MSSSTNTSPIKTPGQPITRDGSASTQGTNEYRTPDGSPTKPTPGIPAKAALNSWRGVPIAPAPNTNTPRATPAETTPPTAIVEDYASNRQPSSSPPLPSQGLPSRPIKKELEPFPELSTQPMSKLTDDDDEDMPIDEDLGADIRALIYDSAAPSVADDDDLELPDLDEVFSQALVPPKKAQLPSPKAKKSSTSTIRDSPPIEDEQDQLDDDMHDMNQPPVAKSPSPPPTRLPSRIVKLEKKAKPPTQKPRKRPAPSPPTDEEYIDVDALSDSPPSGPPRRSGRVSIAPTRLLPNSPSQPMASSSKLRRTNGAADVSSAKPGSSFRPLSRQSNRHLLPKSPAKNAVHVLLDRPRHTPHISPSRPKASAVLHSNASQLPSPSKTVAPTEVPSDNLPEVHRAKMHHKYWYLDGNIVIRLTDGPDIWDFRLLRSELKRKSEHFKKALSDEARLKRDGCPIYEIPANFELTLKDFETLYLAVDEGIHFAVAPVEFSTLSSLLRSSTLLQFQSIQSWAVRSFENMWEPRAYFDGLKRKGRPRADAKESIALARVVGSIANGVLKAAFYELLRIPDFGLGEIEDVVDEDGSVMDVDAEEETRSKKSTAVTPSCRLSPSDVHRLLRARLELTREWQDVVLGLGSRSNCNMPVHPKPAGSAAPVVSQSPQKEGTSTTPAPAPIVPSDVPAVTSGSGHPAPTVLCGANLRSCWSTLIYDSGIYEDFQYDPISGLDHLHAASKKWGVGEVWCGGCMETNRSDWLKAREKIWKRLDSWLGLQTLE